LDPGGEELSLAYSVMLLDEQPAWCASISPAGYPKVTSRPTHDGDHIQQYILSQVVVK
jgi:hypothetical protein